MTPTIRDWWADLRTRINTAMFFAARWRDTLAIVRAQNFQILQLADENARLRAELSRIQNKKVR